MKSIAFYISVFCLSGLALTSCDIIDNPYPEVTTEPRPTLTVTQALDSTESAHDSINGVVTPVQKVLLEDYTGHQCGNCPSAAVKARELKATHGDKLIVMAVHAGFFAKVYTDTTASTKFKTNWTTPEGEKWNDVFGVASYPAGLINRTPKAGSTSRVQGIATWPAAISAQLAETPQVSLTITPMFDEISRKVNFKVRSKYLTNLTGKYSLMVVITEDGVINWQKNYGAAAGGDPGYPTGDVPNYVHPHAVRRVLTSDLGKPNKENPQANDVTNEYFSTTLESTWDAHKCSIIAFIVDDASDEVIQVEEVHVAE